MGFLVLGRTPLGHHPTVARTSWMAHLRGKPILALGHSSDLESVPECWLIWGLKDVGVLLFHSETLEW